MLVSVYPKVVKWLLKCRRGAHQNPKVTLGMTTFSMKDCLASLAHRTDKCFDFGVWNVVPFLN